MPKRRVTQVMRQADRLLEVLVGAQGAGDGARDLSYFQGVGQASAVVIALVDDEHLGLVFQAAKGSRVQNAIPVALEGSAVFWFVFRVRPAPGIPAVQPIGSQALIFDDFEFLAREVHLENYHVTSQANS